MNVRRVILRGAAVAVSSAGLVTLAGAGSASMAGASSRVVATPDKPAPPCSSSDVVIAAKTNHKAYPPGETVVMTSSIKNVSSGPCSIYLGLDPGYSPVFNVTNAQGKTVWDRCWLNDEPGACFEIVKSHNLQPGHTYKQTASWDQRSGPDGGPVVQVPQGVYTFTTAYLGQEQIASVDFDIIVG